MYAVIQQVTVHPQLAIQTFVRDNSDRFLVLTVAAVSGCRLWFACIKTNID